MIISNMRSKGAGLAITAGLLFAPAIQASNLDVYYVADSSFDLEGDGTKLEFGSDGGYGAKGQFHFTKQLFFSLEYQKSDYDKAKLEGVGSGPIDSSLEGIRGGAGFHFLGDAPFYVLAEYVRLEVETEGDSNDDDGYGIHLGARDILPGGFGYYAQVGYLDVGDAGDGFEGLIGASFNFTESFAVFADYRYTQLKDDSDVEATIGDLRTGLRLLF